MLSSPSRSSQGFLALALALLSIVGVTSAVALPAPTPAKQDNYLLSMAALGWPKQTIKINNTSVDIYCQPNSTVPISVPGSQCRSRISVNETRITAATACANMQNDTAPLAMMNPMNKPDYVHSATSDGPIVDSEDGGPGSEARLRVKASSGPIDKASCEAVFNAIIDKCVSPLESDQSKRNQAGLAYTSQIWARTDPETSVKAAGGRWLQTLQFNVAAARCLP
ncbi:MAG: hypothetical protein M1825_004632 [Sarcosagium campestre]|nr:MAG: hypothetical protein M1825_004632 [Sarcosagium campestre]